MNPPPSEADPLNEDERARSNFVKELVQRLDEQPGATTNRFTIPQRLIVQFWDDLDQLPPDVRDCMESWNILKRSGFQIEMFDESSAREFIQTHLGPRYVSAFDKCYHPSMKSDYFRYAYILIKGGFYVDADDVYHGTIIDQLFTDGKLKLQPFCYDIATAKMVSPQTFIKPGANEWSWIFYLARPDNLWVKPT